MKRARAALLPPLLLAACATEPRTDFVALGYEAGDALFDGARRELTDDAPIVYAVFTPVGHPATSSPFGQIFAEHVASRLVQRGTKVVEVRLREAIAVREGGPYALSDDVRDVARRGLGRRSFRPAATRRSARAPQAGGVAPRTIGSDRWSSG